MLIGYVRVSKADGTQTLAPQRDAMLAAGVEPDRICEDLASGRRDDRPGLTACLRPSSPATRSCCGSSAATFANWSTPSGHARHWPEGAGRRRLADRQDDGQRAPGVRHLRRLRRVRARADRRPAMLPAAGRAPHAVSRQASNTRPESHVPRPANPQHRTFRLDSEMGSERLTQVLSSFGEKGGLKSRRWEAPGRAPSSRHEW